MNTTQNLRKLRSVLGGFCKKILTTLSAWLEETPLASSRLAIELALASQENGLLNAAGKADWVEDACVIKMGERTLSFEYED